mmetsp:Transcript_27666/g.64101  ORF Transcript_27666/g.64101 Transcript_27666/m.64101 type:complete len:316 (-) Transcript_27666:28-975(-)
MPDVSWSTCDGIIPRFTIGYDPTRLWIRLQHCTNSRNNHYCRHNLQMRKQPRTTNFASFNRIWSMLQNKGGWVSVFLKFPQYLILSIGYPCVRTKLFSKSQTQTIVFALELLDNLGHDKVRQSPQTQMLEQAEIAPGDDGGLREVFVPLSDGLLSRILSKVPSYGGGPKDLGAHWVPSVACGVLGHLLENRPHSQVVLADFDWLPAPDLSGGSPPPITEWAAGEPIVTSMDGLDHACYLQSPPLCDILFPTDFRKLLRFVQHSVRGRDQEAKVQKQAAFLQACGPHLVAETKSWLTGYSPLLDDFGNCSVLTISK